MAKCVYPGCNTVADIEMNTAHKNLCHEHYALWCAEQNALDSARAIIKHDTGRDGDYVQVYVGNWTALRDALLTLNAARQRLEKMVADEVVSK